VWHCSVAPLAGKLVTERQLRLLAYSHLRGVGDSSCEWVELSSRAFHLRRRLTAPEQLQTGDVMDLRGTEEGRLRFEALRESLPPPLVRMALEEIGVCGQ
jgi:hypothetical protein